MKHGALGYGSHLQLIPSTSKAVACAVISTAGNVTTRPTAQTTTSARTGAHGSPRSARECHGQMIGSQILRRHVPLPWSGIWRQVALLHLPLCDLHLTLHPSHIMLAAASISSLYKKTFRTRQGIFTFFLGTAVASPTGGPGQQHAAA